MNIFELRITQPSGARNYLFCVIERYFFLFFSHAKTLGFTKQFSSNSYVLLRRLTCTRHESWTADRESAHLRKPHFLFEMYTAWSLDCRQGKPRSLSQGIVAVGKTQRKSRSYLRRWTRPCTEEVPRTRHWYERAEDSSGSSGEQLYAQAAISYATLREK